ncbi:single-stranded-DNA-specific exonuclease RecJ [Bacillus sp. 03113]|uniref:single-stranded-DNA-specific exonuclease RecJ n=1 Tax=Bacillus sp. 03113 TaxID=2578211 RepID=UPI0011431C79|nr:single-stranded-DNA-specific exonuclease RecJ [Bacillus sp. 03113]
MLRSKSRWIVRDTEKNHIDQLVNELKITPLVAALLVNRGLTSIDDAREFLFDHEQTFHDPYLLTDMEKAVARIRKAIEDQEQILIFGDYDADGVTSTTVLMKTLLELGANVDFYIPNRFTEGYGPNEGAFTHAFDIGVQLIITVDTGIAAVHEAKVAKDLGMDLIITDHHEPGPILPDAFAIVHPKHPDSEYPFKELAGVGVSFKLSHALYGKLPEHLLEIAAIGTIADLVSLTGENRLIAKKGIQKLRGTGNVGLKRLFHVAKIDQAELNEETIGFGIAPRLNAPGRLDQADPAVQLLLTDDISEAESIADEIDQINKDRQAIVNEITVEAIAEVDQHFPIDENAVLIIGKEGWNAGVIGIVASRLVEKFYRPTIVLSYDHEKGIAKGSARSIVGFDLFHNLSQCRDILPHFGGHPMAAGMTLKIEDIEELRSRLNQQANDILTEEDFKRITYLDAEINIKEIDIASLDEMNQLSPYGTGNPKPKVLIQGAGIGQMKKIGSNQNHLKLVLEKESASLDGVGFGLGDLCDQIAPVSKVSVIGELSINEWNNIRKPQIFIQDAAVETWQLFDFRGNRVDKLIEDASVKDATWVFFQETLSYAYQNKIKGKCEVVKTMEDAVSIQLEKAQVILVDLPANLDLLKQVVAGKSPDRIYACFYKEDSAFLSTMPTRDHFKWYYAFLAKKSPFNLSQHGNELAKYRGWSKETIDFMSRVFFELDFVTIENGLISLNKQARKRDLDESVSYQKKQNQFKLEKELIFSSYQQLKSWFDLAINDSVKIEGEVEEWI